jgi:hypothetical protein
VPVATNTDSTRQVVLDLLKDMTNPKMAAMHQAEALAAIAVALVYVGDAIRDTGWSPFEEAAVGRARGDG